LEEMAQKGGHAQRRWRRNLAFAATAFVLFLGLLLALEGGVRLLGIWSPASFRDPWMGCSDAYPFYLPAEGDAGEMRTSPWRQDMRPRTFRVPRPDGTFRVFMLGGSTVAFGLAEEVERQLAERLPGTKVEVINSGIAGADSLIHGNVLKEVLGYAPDAIVVYAGHNEWSAWRHNPQFRPPGLVLRTRMSLEKHSRLFMAAAAGVRAVRRRFAARFGQGTEAPRSFFDHSEKGPATDAEKRIVEGHYAANLAEMAARARAAGIPIYFCTLVSNLFVDPNWVGGVPPAGADGDRPPEMPDDPSLDHFRQGQALFAAGEREKGLEELRIARELHPTPVRVWGAMNDVVRKAGAQDGARLIDVAAAFEPAAFLAHAHEELFLDSMHPAAVGSKIMGAVIADALQGR
jgi:lysophospholipase L1-like esterase